MTHRDSNRPRRLLTALLAAAGLLAVLAVGAGVAPAAAHDGDAVIVIEAAHPEGMSIHYIVRVTWQDDGHPAADATVTATAVGGGGTQLTPVPLHPADDDGRYAGVVEYPSPGSWTVRVTAVRPTGSVEEEQVVAPPPAEEETADDGTATTAADDGFAPADDGTGAAGSENGEQAASEGDGGSGMPVLLIVVAALVVVGGAVAAVATIRRHRPTAGQAAGSDGDGDPGEPAPGAGAGGPAGAGGARAGGDAGTPGDA